MQASGLQFVIRDPTSDNFRKQRLCLLQLKYIEEFLVEIVLTRVYTLY